MTNQELIDIPAKILSQLGGYEFIIMTGSKNIAYYGMALTMSLSKNKSKASHLKIEYDYNSDLYIVSFLKITLKKGIEILNKIDGVYSDMLIRIFEEETGLDTRIPAIYRKQN